MYQDDDTNNELNNLILETFKEFEKIEDNIETLTNTNKELCKGKIDEILLAIELNNPLIFTILMTYGISYPASRQIVKNIIKSTLMYNLDSPLKPPPNIIPAKNEQEIKAVDPGAIRPCKYRYVYIWLNNDVSFWAYLTFIGKKSVAGYKWNGRKWIYFGIDLNRIESFICY